MDKVMAYTEENWNRLERLKVNKQSVFATRSHYQSGKWLLQTSIHRQRDAAGLPTFTYMYTRSNLFGNDDDICYGRDRGGNQGRRKPSERCTQVVAGSEGVLQKLMDGLNRTAKEYDLKVNIEKTKVMKVSRK